jgi:hypothetical protein
VRRRLVVALLGLLAPALTACALFGSGALFGGETTVAVSVAADLNEDFPLAVELVYAYEKKLAGELAGKTAADWFAGREQFARDHPGAFESWRWEWVPGQPAHDVRVEYRVGAQPPFVFAGYSAKGDHRQQVPIGQDFALLLGRTDFEVKLLR